MFDLVDPVGHETAGRDEIPERVDRRQAMAGRERDDEIAMQDGGVIRRQEQTAVRRARKRLDGALDVGGGLDGAGHKLDRERWGDGLGRPQEVIVGGCLGIADKSGARHARRDLLEHRQPLADDACLDTAAGP